MKWNEKDEKHINTLSELGNLSGNWKDKAHKVSESTEDLTTSTNNLNRSIAKHSAFQGHLELSWN